MPTTAPWSQKHLEAATIKNEPPIIVQPWNMPTSPPNNPFSYSTRLHQYHPKTPHHAPEQATSHHTLAIYHPTWHDHIHSAQQFHECRIRALNWAPCKRVHLHQTHSLRLITCINHEKSVITHAGEM
ncbi:hypothetical protein KC19_7G138600 [Ceratodon purpureus]|uniref:Uncharacterized protein n=1 Tax=Ceratodon purpureus TaxID=3225 RepID=A0A8T0HAS7_CERPU|nr:hypothetical protein KC19_7G138600 [Ceratodon purpureus]